MDYGDKSEGFNRSRFFNYHSDCFDCGVCLHVAREPKECNECGQVYCTSCMPNKCMNCETPGKIDKMSRVQKKVYSDLVLKCKFCDLGIKVDLIDQHEEECNKQCVNFECCGNFIQKDNNEKICDTICKLLSQVKKARSKEEIYQYLKNVTQQNIVLSENIPKNFEPSIIQTLNVSNKWDSQRKGDGIILSDGDQKAFLSDQAHTFRTVVAKYGYESDIAYWEIEADDRTENEIKTGVTKCRDFNFNTTFCDFEFGWAFYGLAQLRHNSNNQGHGFGKKFKKTGVLGVCLNMKLGTLSFSLDGEYMGCAFKDEKLKSGPIYPAAALLNVAGCKITSGKPVPSMFTS